MRHGLHDHLAQPLARAHDICGVDRLVGRYLNELLHAAGIRGTDEVERTEHVVADGLLRAGLHERNMLVRGGVEHDLGTVAVHQAHESRAVADRADFDGKVKVRTVSEFQLLLNVVGVVLVNIEDDQPLGTVLDDLAAQLAADGAAATGDQHGASEQQPLHGGNIQLDGIPAQQILDPHLPQLLADRLPVDQL